MRTIISLIALFVSTAALAAEPAPLPPAMPWHGASEKLVAKPDDPWITPAEASGFRQTPNYGETRAYLERLVAASGGLLTLEVFGQTAQGRDLIAGVPKTIRIGDEEIREALAETVERIIEAVRSVQWRRGRRRWV